ncbi:MAG: peptidoglycan recognition family protein [Bacteroidales bacterium]|jgi:N-acetyl-anhydromuramyl-L-alanine amidase AmpD|nr:peptidoglycan recognition family protein [Bacteroidales bacterium]
MKIIDITGRFLDNSLRRNSIEDLRIVFHWTASSTAKSAIDWLDTRLGGKGTVGYNYIIDRDGTIYVLADPGERWMHNSGLGANYDQNTISISLVMKDETDPVSQNQEYASRQLLLDLNSKFEIKEITHHAHINRNKRDFPEKLWESFIASVYSDFDISEYSKITT